MSGVVEQFEFSDAFVVQHSETVGMWMGDAPFDTVGASSISAPAVARHVEHRVRRVDVAWLLGCHACG